MLTFVALLLSSTLVFSYLSSSKLDGRLPMHGFEHSSAGYFFYIFSILLILPYLTLYRFFHLSILGFLSKRIIEKRTSHRFLYTLGISIVFALIFPIALLLLSNWISYFIHYLEFKLHGNLLYYFNSGFELFVYYLCVSLFFWRDQAP